LALVTDARSNVTSYGYDANGNLTSITYANGSRESWGHDSLGNPTAWTNRRGNATPDDPNDHVIAYDYDADGHLVSELPCFGRLQRRHDLRELRLREQHVAKERRQVDAGLAAQCVSDLLDRSPLAFVLQPVGESRHQGHRQCRSGLFCVHARKITQSQRNV